MRVDPYYQDDYCTIYHADCRDVLPAIDPATVDLVLTDPPYGIAWDTDYAGRGMGRMATYAPVRGDDEPFDPSHLLRFPRLVLFGANNYADKLPNSAGWIVWDKTGQGRNVTDLSDCELAWTNVTGGVRLFSHLWKGLLKDSERSTKRCHPTQKPVALMSWIIGKFGDDHERQRFILDPYMGSGSTMRAAKDRGRKCIGIEIEERYCEIAVKRLGQEVLAL